MRLVHRITAAIATVLLLQLSLLGTGALCALHGDRGMSQTHDHAMGASMKDHATSSVSMVDAGDQGMPNECNNGMDDSCGNPWAPGSCASMSSCAVAISAPVASAASADFAFLATDLPEPFVTATSRTVAPELPPPRA